MEAESENDVMSRGRGNENSMQGMKDVSGVKC